MGSRSRGFFSRVSEMKDDTRSESEQGLSMGWFMKGFGLNLLQERYGGTPQNPIPLLRH